MVVEIYRKKDMDKCRVLGRILGNDRLVVKELATNRVYVVDVDEFIRRFI